MAILSPSGLETIVGIPAWHFLFNRDFELLNDKLLKINALADVLGVPTNGQVLTWDAVAVTWKPRSY